MPDDELSEILGPAIFNCPFEPNIQTDEYISEICIAKKKYLITYILLKIIEPG
jgi:hypothetical protein